MINEQPVENLLVVETTDDGDTWVEWTGALNEAEIHRGGRRAGASSTVDVGTLIATLLNAGDPLEDDRLKPNLRVRVRARASGVSVFTARLVDLATAYVLDKARATTSTRVTIAAADAVSSHAAVTRHGAVVEGGVGYESWAQRIIRLAGSAVTEVNPPEDDSPIVRYAI